MTDIVLRMKTLPDLTDEQAWAVVNEGAREIERLRALVAWIDDKPECRAAQFRGLQEEIARMGAALAPFAALGQRLAGNNHDAAPIKQCFFHSPGIDSLNAGHLKAALAALTQ
jgi:hypothetical protein